MGTDREPKRHKFATEEKPARDGLWVRKIGDRLVPMLGANRTPTDRVLLRQERNRRRYGTDHRQ